MKKESLSLLLGFWGHQAQILERISKEIKTTPLRSRQGTAYTGFLLHNLYSALEDLFQEVAKTFENHIEDPSKFHRELLRRMALEIPGIRPRLLSDKSQMILDELRAFRHIFRHAYDYELSADRIRDLRKRLLTQWKIVDADLEAFRTFLEEAIRE